MPEAEKSITLRTPTFQKLPKSPEVPKLPKSKTRNTVAIENSFFLLSFRALSEFRSAEQRRERSPEDESVTMPLQGILSRQNCPRHPDVRLISS